MSGTYHLNWTSRMSDADAGTEDILERSIKAEGRRFIPGKSEENTTLQAKEAPKGPFLKSHGLLKLSYQQILDETTGDGVSEVMTLRFDEDGRIGKVTMNRPGSRFRLEFDSGKWYHADYETVGGELMVQILTRELTGICKDDRFWLRIRYDLWLDEHTMQKQEIEIHGAKKISLA